MHFSSITSSSRCDSVGLLVMMAASSAYCLSHTVINFVFLRALSLCSRKASQSHLYLRCTPGSFWSYSPRWEHSKVTANKKMLKCRVARNVPCLTPMVTSKGTEVPPATLTEAVLPVCNALNNLRTMEGQPNRLRIANRRSLLTVSNVFFFQVDKGDVHWLVLLAPFPSSCRQSKIVSFVLLSGLKPL